jgi:hypothetical protein
MQFDDIVRMFPQARLQVMELLWESFHVSSQSDEAVPRWHQQVLQDRLRRLAQDAEGIMPWEQTKDRLGVLTKLMDSK